MKQEAINTFSDGLTYDMHPSTTANTLLTDCINGTFVTSNGDELVLQNDAGNARLIDSNGDPVKLSEGFYPIGIKEFGGILYIISAKKPTATEFLAGAHIKDTVYYLGIDYYLCLADNSLSDMFDENYWEFIGTITDFNNRFGQVEFGSYPSPGNVVGGSPIVSTNVAVNIDETMLYEYQNLSDTVFSSGDNIVFTSGSIDNQYALSTYDSDGNYIPKFYKLSLLQKLENGSIDLTKDIWEKFWADTSIVTRGFSWLDTNEFQYNCPSTYKGELVAFLEIESLQVFEVTKSPVFERDVAGNFIFVMSAKAEDYGLIEVGTIDISIKFDSVTFTASQIPDVDGNVTYSINIGKDLAAQNAIYEVTPKIFYSGVSIHDDLPDYYKNSHKFTGEVDVISDFALLTVRIANENNNIFNIEINNSPELLAGASISAVNTTEWTTVCRKGEEIQITITHPTLSQSFYPIENNSIFVASDIEVEYAFIVAIREFTYLNEYIDHGYKRFSWRYPVSLGAIDYQLNTYKRNIGDLLWNQLSGGRDMKSYGSIYYIKDDGNLDTDFMRIKVDSEDYRITLEAGTQSDIDTYYPGGEFVIDNPLRNIDTYYRVPDFKGTGITFYFFPEYTKDNVIVES